MGWRRRLKKLRNRREPGKLPEPLKWRPRVRIFGLISGLIGGIGTVVLVQKYGVAPLGRALTLQGVFGGLASGIVIPSAIWGVVVVVHNRKLRKAAAKLGHRVAPPSMPTPGAAALLLVPLAFIGIAVASSMPPAGADLSGTCFGFVNGQDFKDLPTNKDNVIQIGEDGGLSVTVGSPVGITFGEIGIKYFGRTWIIIGGGDEGDAGDPEDAGDGGDLTLDFDNDSLSLLGPGIYEFYGKATQVGGASCTGSFLYNVPGNPLETPIGQAAAAATAVGAVGMVGMSLSGLAEGSRYISELQSVVVDIDGDGIADATAYDMDGDGTADTFGLDTDGDGTIDELAYDSTGDGVIDTALLLSDLGLPPADAAAAAAAAQAAADPEQDVADEEEDEDEEENDTIVTLKLLHPVGRSPSILHQGWLFGARCTVQRGEDSEDMSGEVQWGGSASKWSPPMGSQSRPWFGAEGPNTIELSVMVDGERHERTFTVNVVSAQNYARLGDVTNVPADAHGCPTCPHNCKGKIIAGSPTVLIDNLPAARVGDPGVHAACCGPNMFTIGSGNPAVLIDGRPAARIDDRTDDCGGTGSIIQGSPRTPRG